MQQEYLLSVITINLNRAADLQRTLQSVVEQPGFEQVEYVVIDGGSTDGSLELIQQHAPQITRWISEPDGGIYAAMNKGIHLASGTFLLFLNAGDTLYPNVLSGVLEELRTAPADIVAADVGKELGYGRIMRYAPPGQFELKDFFVHWIPHCAAFIRRSLFFQIGMYDESMRIVSDWKFFILAICKHRATYRHIPVLLSQFQYGGISGKPEEKARSEAERMSVLEAHFSPEYREVLKGLERRAQWRRWTGYTRVFNFLRWGRRTLYHWVKV